LDAFNTTVTAAPLPALATAAVTGTSVLAELLEIDAASWPPGSRSSVLEKVKPAAEGWRVP